MLQHRAEFIHLQRGDVRHEERGVRIAHAGGGGIGHRSERQVQVQRVHRPRQRDLRPVQPGRPHVHLHAAVGQHFGAVRVADPHEGVCVRAGKRRLDADELVAADAGAPVGQRGGAGWREAEHAGSFVEHDEVVAAAMHLAKGGTHDGGYRAGRAGAPCVNRLGGLRIVAVGGATRAVRTLASFVA